MNRVAKPVNIEATDPSTIRTSSGFSDHRLSWRVALCITAFAFLIRLGCAFAWQGMVESGGGFFRFGDSESYWILARTIADGTPYQYGSSESKIFRAPLYPIFLSPFTRLTSNPSGISHTCVMGARIAGALLGAYCVWVIMVLTVRLAGARAGACAGILAAVYPGAIGMSVFVLSEAVFCPLILSSLSLVWLGFKSRILDGDRFLRMTICFLFAGCLSGAACLARPSWSLWIGFLFLYAMGAGWFACKDGSTRKRVGSPIAAIAAFGLGTIVVMIPWWIRNYQITGKFVPTTLQVGASLYDGWHPNASGRSDENMQFVDTFIREQRAQDEMLAQQSQVLESTFEWRLDRRMASASLAWARENSSDVLKLGMIKFVKTWSPLPVARELGSNSVRWAEGCAYSIIMLTAAMGMWRLRSQSGAWLFAMPCLYFAILHMIFIGSVRYRQPSVLILCVLAGAGCSLAMQWMFPCVGSHAGTTARENNTTEKIDGSIASRDGSPTRSQ